jgi:hypothetical protein
MIRFIDISLAQLDHEVKGVLSRGYGTDIAELEEQMSTLCRMALTVMARSNSLFYSFEHTVMEVFAHAMASFAIPRLSIFWPEVYLVT